METIEGVALTIGVTLTIGLTLTTITLSGVGVFSVTVALGAADGAGAGSGAGWEGAGVAGGVPATAAGVFGDFAGETVSVVIVSGKSVIISPSWESLATRRKDESLGSERLTSPDMVLNP